MLKINYTDHSLQRLNERGISKKQIGEAIRDGDKDYAGGDLRKSIHRNETSSIVVIYSIKSAEK
jgi:hypothetical protein